MFSDNQSKTPFLPRRDKHLHAVVPYSPSQCYEEMLISAEDESYDKKGASQISEVWLDNMSPSQGGVTKIDSQQPKKFIIPIIEEEEEESNMMGGYSKDWIIYSLAASILIALCNTSMSDLSKLGFEGILYLGPGSMLCGLIYWSAILPFTTYHPQGYKLLNDEPSSSFLWQSLSFLLFSSVYLFTQLSIVLAFSQSLQAGVNEGIITSIWAITPLFSALLDYLIFQVSLSVKHLVGVVSLVACAGCISLSSLMGEGASGRESSISPAVPVAVAIVGSILMAVRSFQGKQLVVRGGFDAFNLSFGSLFVQGLALTGVLIHLKSEEGLSLHYMVIGTLCAILNTLGGVAIVKASSVGPLGPVNALFTSSSSVLFCLLQFARFGKHPNSLEIAGMLIGILGAFILTIPDQMRGIALWVLRGGRGGKKQ
ncbi:hypothetical protein FGO68_gene17190 [Halteria grandinella]|uniref:EamA domain-containing protein n=1 Tax=Halteria grandinella TaxID=5974 RepID=A0A8J8NPX3_HALGN|nr:hypothetical protein FGO68_gene17190 [Halteria grandinella]